MRHLLIGILLMIYVLVSSHLVEIMKLPSLLKHYSLHKKESKCLSFSEFLSLHYTTSHEQESRHDHDGLPFKAIKDYSGISIASLCEVFSILDFQIPSYTDYHRGSPYPFRYASQFPDSIWQPPKV